MAAREPLAQLGQADEEKREQRAAVPVVVAQDVQVVEDVLVEQVSLVEEEHGVTALGRELLDVPSDLVEHGGRGGLRVQPEREADVAVEVPAPERPLCQGR